MIYSLSGYNSLIPFQLWWRETLGKLGRYRNICSMTTSYLSLTPQFPKCFIVWQMYHWNLVRRKWTGEKWGIRYFSISAKTRWSHRLQYYFLILIGFLPVFLKAVLGNIANQSVFKILLLTFLEDFIDILLFPFWKTHLLVYIHCTKK